MDEENEILGDQKSIRVEFDGDNFFISQDGGEDDHGKSVEHCISVQKENWRKFIDRLSKYAENEFNKK